MNVGIDLEQISRFELGKTNKFILNNFTEYEINYCFSKTNPSQHLCGIFCAKEALFKSLNRKIYISSNLNLEVKHNTLNKPIISIINDKLNISDDFDVSISHSGEYATAIVIKFDKNK